MSVRTKFPPNGEKQLIDVFKGGKFMSRLILEKMPEDIDLDAIRAFRRRVERSR